ncbi:MAG: amidohydrolase family protein [Rhodospirillales bacterium]
MLIRAATLLNGQRVDVRVGGGMVAEIAASLQAHDEDMVIEAEGGALLPGLHDHHIHLFALASSFRSVFCGTPLGAAGLVERLRAAPGDGWVRGVAYHETVAGDIDASWLDRAVPDRPVRIQHRSGRLWIFNSAALALLGGGAAGTPLECAAGRATGRLYDGDQWLRERLKPEAPSLAWASARLAARGVTSVSDATAANDAGAFQLLRRARQTGELRQHVAVMGGEEIAACESVDGCAALARKIHLHDGDYPEPEAFMAMLHHATAHGLQVAVHCVTEADLAYALSLMEEVGPSRGYRIEHASVVPPDMLSRMAAAGVTVVTQPHFIAERGDAYRADVPVPEHDWLYRGAAFLAHGVKLGGGDGCAVREFRSVAGNAGGGGAAHARRRRAGAGGAADTGASFGTVHDTLVSAGGRARRVRAGAAADLCLLRQPWALARVALDRVEVMAAVQDGVIIHRDVSALRSKRNEMAQ